jgi:hypothetical protein
MQTYKHLVFVPTIDPVSDALHHVKVVGVDADGVWLLPSLILLRHYPDTAAFAPVIGFRIRRYLERLNFPFYLLHLDVVGGYLGDFTQVAGT